MVNLNKSKSKKVIKDFNPQPAKKMELKFKNPKHPDQKYYLIRFEGKFTKDDIRQYAQKKSNQISAKAPESAVFQVTIKTKSGRFYSGEQTRPGEDVKLWNHSDSDGNIEIDDDDIDGFDLLFTLPEDDE